MLEDSEESIVILLENGADILTKDLDGVSPLMMCNTNKRLRSLILKKNLNKKEEEEQDESSENPKKGKKSKTLTPRRRKPHSAIKKGITLKRTLSKQSKSGAIKNSPEHGLKNETSPPSSINTKRKMKKTKASKACKLQKINGTPSISSTSSTNEIDEGIPVKYKSEKGLKRVYSYNEEYSKDYRSTDQHHQNSPEHCHDKRNPYYDDEEDEDNLYSSKQYLNFRFNNRKNTGNSTGKSEEDDDSVTNVFREAFSSLIDHDSEETSCGILSDDESSSNSDTVFY